MKLTILDAGYCTAPQHITSGMGSWRPARLPALYALLEHPRFGAVLFDTGYGLQFFSETRQFPLSLYQRLTPVTLEESDLAVHRLARRGLRPGDIGTILISHFHADHISALRDFPQARLLYFQSAWQAVQGRQGWQALRLGFVPGLLPADFDERGQVLAPDHLRPMPPEYAPFKIGVNLFGDESAWAVRLPGHATGQMGLFVNTDDGQHYFLVADACWHSRAFREGRGPHPLANLIFANPAQYRQTLAGLHQFHLSQPQVHLIPSHCPEAQARYVSPEPS
jgi:glyoxylase-like metal-dependent hydrolase (beta-lactamase superfamily II)